MKEIGGYFELELSSGEEYHKEAVKLNSGRNALEYIIKARSFKKIYLPYYTCDVVLQPIIRLNLDYEFYSIDENLEPIFNFNSTRSDEAILYTNYFGIKDAYIKEISKKAKNLIIDNAQSFFSDANPNIDTFYSPRKFFGCPDGAYLYTDAIFKEPLEQDSSFDRADHLLMRADLGASSGYKEFHMNDKKFDEIPLRKMSNLTTKFLKSINYQEKKTLRENNFEHLNTLLGSYNYLRAIPQDAIPALSYPFFVPGKDLREILIANKVFVPQYWGNVLDWASAGSLEVQFAKYMVHLPIDHRYNLDDMRRIISIIKSIL